MILQASKQSINMKLNKIININIFFSLMRRVSVVIFSGEKLPCMRICHLNEKYVLNLKNQCNF